MTQSSKYDAVIVGAGHNGLVAACYLALAGLSVLMLEKNPEIGGATISRRAFPGIDARISVYSYLVSLLPEQILTDLGIQFSTRRRATASYTPVPRGGAVDGLLISNTDEEATRQSFQAFTGSEQEYQNYHHLDRRLTDFAQRVWPTLLAPLPAKANLRDTFSTPELRQTWDSLVERPLGELIEEHLHDDTVRGAVFTDAKIGVSTYPADPTLLQNRTFLYHIVGHGTGEWRVPVGGMGALVDALADRARSLGVRLQTGAEVTRVAYGQPSTVIYHQGDSLSSVDARFVLLNVSSDIANILLPGTWAEEQVEGSVFKINMLLKRLPALKDPRVAAVDAFSGTFHLHEGYAQMQESYHAARQSQILPRIPGEMYCHSLTDPSILSAGLQRQGYQTLTLFGLDVPYHWFPGQNGTRRQALTAQFLAGINDFLAEDIHDCLAIDADGKPCLEAKTPLDLEAALGLPRGNIFHGNLTWPFAETEEQAGTWGVETAFRGVVLCGSSARRGGAVSGIPGHNAAMHVLEQAGLRP